MFHSVGIITCWLNKNNSLLKHMWAPIHKPVPRHSNVAIRDGVQDTGALGPAVEALQLWHCTVGSITTATHWWGRIKKHLCTYIYVYIKKPQVVKMFTEPLIKTCLMMRCSFWPVWHHTIKFKLYNWASSLEIFDKDIMQMEIHMVKCKHKCNACRFILRVPQALIKVVLRLLCYDIGLCARRHRSSR